MGRPSPSISVPRDREGIDPDALDARLKRAAETLTEAANGTHEFKARLAARKLRELRAAALLDTANWAAKNTNRRIY